MSVYMFGVGHGKLSTKLFNRVVSIVKPMEVSFHNVDNPGNGWIYWFCCTNKGNPFDQWKENQVRAALDEAEIQLP